MLISRFGKSSIGTLIFLRPCQALKVPDRIAGRCILQLSSSGGQGKPSLELLVEIALYFHVSTDYLLLGRELARASRIASCIGVSSILVPSEILKGILSDCLSLL